MNATTTPSDSWGPWARDIGAAERLARLRSMRAICQLMLGKLHPLVRALFLAESGEPVDMAAACIELDRMPARDRRKVLASYAALIAFKAQRDAEGG